MKSLRDSFIPPERAIDTSPYPGYVILQKERQIQPKKIERKRCPSQLNVKLFTKNINNFCLRFFSNDPRTAHYCDTVKRKQTPIKMGEYAKMTNIL